MKKRSLIQFWAACIAMLTTMPTNIAFCQNVPDRHYYGADTAFDHVNYFTYVCENVYTYKESDSTYHKIPLDSSVVAFTISSYDLLLAMGVTPDQIDSLKKHLHHSMQNIIRKSVRIYIGIDTSSVQPDPSKQGYNKSAVGFKLFVVPVGDKSEDLVFKRNDIGMAPTPVNASCYNHDKGCLKDMFVLDLNSPCPTMCGFPSIFLDPQKYMSKYPTPPPIRQTQIKRKSIKQIKKEITH